MQLLSNIPNAIINNIGFMAILFMIYECVKWMGKIKPGQLFMFAGTIQAISLVQFLITVFYPNSFSLLLITAKIIAVEATFKEISDPAKLAIERVIASTSTKPETILARKTPVTPK